MRLALLFLTLFITLAVAGQVRFESSSFEALIAKAAAEKKYAMVDAYTEWCGWCRTMDAQTFADSTVGLFFDDRLVAAKYDMETGFGVDLAMKYRVSDYPHFLFFDGSGHLVGRLSGFKKPEEFIAAVEGVLKPENFLPALPEPLNFDLGFPEFHRKSYLKRAERENPSLDSIVAWLQTRPGLLDEVTWGVVHRYVGGGVYAGEVIKARQELIARYGPDEIYDKLATFVFAEVKEAIKDKDEAKLEAALKMADEILDERAGDYKIRYRLYYAQMLADWAAYAEVGSAIWMARNAGYYLYLPIIADNLMKNSADEQVLTEAHTWMRGLTALGNPTFDQLLTAATLANRLGKESEYENYVKMARAIATESQLEKLSILY